MAKKEQKETTKNKKSFFKGFKAELKKVSWPTPKQLVNNTVAVISIVLLTAVIVFVLDIVFETINSQGINRLKQMVSNSVEENTTSEENTADDTSEEEETTEEENAADDTSEEGETTESTENVEVEATNPEANTNTEDTTSENTTSNE